MFVLYHHRRRLKLFIEAELNRTVSCNKGLEKTPEIPIREERAKKIITRKERKALQQYEGTAFHGWSKTCAIPHTFNARIRKVCPVAQKYFFARKDNYFVSWKDVFAALKSGIVMKKQNLLDKGLCLFTGVNRINRCIHPIEKVGTL